MTPLAPLQQIKTLDLTALLPGPYCTMLLAALGAQARKVEPGPGKPAGWILTRWPLTNFFWLVWGKGRPGAEPAELMGWISC